MGYQAVRTERWKYIRYTALEGMDELYDLRRDPYEMRNLIADAAVRGTLESLRSELRSLVK
jgi:N-acetylglucosamine-6-sulfatase